MSDAPAPPLAYSDWGEDREAIEFLEMEFNPEGGVSMSAANHAVYDDKYHTLLEV